MTKLNLALDKSVRVENNHKHKRTLAHDLSKSKPIKMAVNKIPTTPTITDSQVCIFGINKYSSNSQYV